MSTAASPSTCTLIINTGWFPSPSPPSVSHTSSLSILPVIEERVEAVGLTFPSLSVHIKASMLSKGIPSFSTPAKPATAPPGFIPEGTFRSDPLWIYHIREDLKNSIDSPPNCPLSLLTASHHVGHLQLQIEVPAPTQSALLLPWPDQLRWLQPAHRPRPADRGAEKDPTVFADSHTVPVCFQQMSRVNDPLVPTGDCWSEMTLAGEPGGPSEAYLLMLWHLEGYFFGALSTLSHRVYFSLSTFHDQEHSTFCILGRDI